MFWRAAADGGLDGYDVETEIAMDESLGGLLTRVRLASGRSQLRIAELLCAASGVATLSRHEISRWEREVRIPSAFWLRWLAVVLEVELARLERAAMISRRSRPAGTAVAPDRPVDADAGPQQRAGAPTRRSDVRQGVRGQAR
jgi:transcriptional regulator with XRE-family HTH domain